MFDWLFGKNKSGSSSTLTGGQQDLLNQWSGMSGQYLPQTMAGLYGGTQNLQNAYSAIPNWENEFQTNVVDPTNQRMNQDLQRVQHSNERHSLGQGTRMDAISTGYGNQLAGMRQNELQNQQNLQMQGLNDAYNRQQQYYSQLSGMMSQPFGVKAIENYQTRTPGLLDYVRGLANTAASVKKATS